MSTMVQLPMFGTMGAPPMPRKAMGSSFFDARTVEDLLAEIAGVLRGGRRCVVTFSGGKDSSLVLDLVWRALAAMPLDERRRMVAEDRAVWVLSSDTGIEQPAIAARLDACHAAINREAPRQEIPLRAVKVMRPVAQSFWVCLIGKGYAAPTPLFRWCTSRLKVDPISSWLDDMVSPEGDIVLITGSRKAESPTRKRSMERGEVVDGLFSPSRATAGALMYAPVADWSVSDVWRWLDAHACPYGGSYWDLMELYRGGGECPLTMTLDRRESCGGTRTGCVVCPVVARDKSLAALIEGGADYLRPIEDLRTFLVETGRGDARFAYRGIRGDADYTIHLQSKGPDRGQLSPRLYHMGARKRILQMALAAQDHARRAGPDPTFTLISEEELAEIQRIWARDWGDWRQSAAWIAEEFGPTGWAPPLNPALERAYWEVDARVLAAALVGLRALATARAPLATARWVADAAVVALRDGRLADRQTLVEETARDLDVPEVLLKRFVYLVEEFVSGRARATRAAALAGMRRLLRCDWRSDGVLVAALYWERDEEAWAEGARARALEDHERRRRPQRDFMDALGPVAPPTQADALLFWILERLAEDDKAPVRRAALASDRWRGTIDRAATEWMNAREKDRSMLLCRDGSYAYQTAIYGSGAARRDRWVAYPASDEMPALPGDEPLHYAVLGTGKGRYRGVEYVGGRWRRLFYTGVEGFWAHLSDDGGSSGLCPWAQYPEYGPAVPLEPYVTWPTDPRARSV